MLPLILHTITAFGKPDSLILGHLNINPIKNKFEATATTIKEYKPFLVSKTKLDSVSQLCNLK